MMILLFWQDSVERQFKDEDTVEFKINKDDGGVF
jgi:hypothetical protein